MKPVKFKSILTKPSDYGGWHFVRVAGKVGDKFQRKDGSRRVVCTINGGESFQCALMPSEGDYVIVVSKSKRDRLRIVAGDHIEVELEADESKYGLPMPEELQEVLNQDPEGDRLFHGLSAGKQRSMLYFISKIKDVDRRIHSSLIFIEHLKNNDGKLVHELLHEELKRPAF